MYGNMYGNYMPYAQQTRQDLIRVNGIDGAKAYQMAPNSVAALFDANDDLMYIKSTDGAGFPALRTFRFTEEQPRLEPQDAREDKMDQLIKSIDELKEMIRNAEQPVSE